MASHLLVIFDIYDTQLAALTMTPLLHVEPFEHRKHYMCAYAFTECLVCVSCTLVQKRFI